MDSEVYSQAVGATLFLAAAYGEATQLPQGLVSDELSSLAVGMREALGLVLRAEEADSLVEAWAASQHVAAAAYRTFGAYPPALVFDGPALRRNQHYPTIRAVLYAAAGYETLNVLPETLVENQLQTLDQVIAGLLRLTIGESSEPAEDWSDTYHAWKNGIEGIYEMFGANEPILEYR